MPEVLFVGTSDAFGAGGRRQSAVLVRGERGTALLDCGVTTNTGLNELGVSRDEVESTESNPPFEILFRQEGAPYGLLQSVFVSSWGIPCTKPPWGELLALEPLWDTYSYDVPGRFGGPALGFNEDINAWDVSQVTTMEVSRPQTSLEEE